MTRGALLDMLTSQLKVYVGRGVTESVERNEHMNDFKKGTEVPKEVSDAILVDFVNFLASGQGMDLGMYTRDLKG